MSLLLSRRGVRLAVDGTRRGLYSGCAVDGRTATEFMCRRQGDGGGVVAAVTERCVEYKSEIDVVGY